VERRDVQVWAGALSAAAVLGLGGGAVVSHAAEAAATASDRSVEALRANAGGAGSTPVKPSPTSLFTGSASSRTTEAAQGTEDFSAVREANVDEGELAKAQRERRKDAQRAAERRAREEARKRKDARDDKPTASATPKPSATRTTAKASPSPSATTSPPMDHDHHMPPTTKPPRDGLDGAVEALQ
jgi:hypothetical protein